MSPRLRFIARRLLQAVPVVLAIVVLNFFLLHLAPGDAATVLAGEAGSATPEYMAQLRARFGLDQPLALQLWAYARNILTLNLGHSFRHDQPVFTLIVARLWPTLLFWLGLMLIVLFSIRLGWLPTSGMESIGAFNTGWARALDIGRHLILPAGALSLFYMALYTRLMRAALLEQAGMDYVTTARAKGLSERRIVWAHTLRNALLPVVTMAGLQTGGLLGGSVIVETVFGWPGLGLLAFQSLFARDLNLLLAIVLLSACTVVVVNLVVDILYTLLDPRIEVV